MFILKPGKARFAFSKSILLLTFCLPALLLRSQTLKGTIIDADTREPIPFTAVIINNSNNGTTADLDGNFLLRLPGETGWLTLQAIGYHTSTVAVSGLDLSKNNTIPLHHNSIGLSEIVVSPGLNPAITLIAAVIKNKPKFDIKNLPHYICNTYSKTYLTFSDQYGNEHTPQQDSSHDARLLKNSYLFFMESVTEKKYKYKNISQEKVTASRVSGFKSAPFGAFASQLQSFTFYDNNLELLGIRYVNPLSKGTFKRYRFEISDTILTGTDTTILVRFYPKKNVRFSALKGTLYIYKNQLVLSNVLAEPAGIPKNSNGIKIQQLYQKMDSVHWFPKQANTEILFNGMSNAKDTSRPLSVIKGVSRLYVRDANVDTAFKIRNRSLASYNGEGFDRKNEAYWNSKREDTLSLKERKTYQLLDSIGKKINLDKKLKWFDALSTGRFQVGYATIDLKRIIRVNDYEQLRLGAGLSTSNKLARFFSVGAYGGYGFGDKAWKYGGHLQVNFNYPQTAYFLTEAASEVVETAGVDFLQEHTDFLSTEKIRNLLISKMDKINYAKASLNLPVFNFIKTSAYVQVQQRSSPFGYAIARDGLLLNERRQFTFNEAGLQLKIWPGEKFTEAMGHLVSMGSRWPVFFINVARGLTNQLFNYTGDFDYTKIDLRIDHTLHFKVKGFVAWQLQAGKVIGSVPYSIQYNNKSSRSDRYLVTAEKTFETMYLNEFISTQYAALFLCYNTGMLLPPNDFLNPELELVHNYGIGTLDNRQNLTNIELNEMSKGYSEAGLRLKGIYRSSFSALGAGIYYRYGNYASENQKRNFVYKLVLSYFF